MTATEIFSKINSIKVENLMRHIQFADTMDFMGLRGFKREGEYHYLAENIELRKLHRYVINHLSTMLYDEGINADVKVQPLSWKGHTRNEVDTSTRKRYVRQLFMDWRDWEKSALLKLADCYHQMESINCVYAEYILEMMEDVTCELKYLERQIIEYESVEWDMVYIMSKQDELHECYRKKSNELEI